MNKVMFKINIVNSIFNKFIIFWQNYTADKISLCILFAE